MIGAACPGSGQTVGLLSPYLNTQMINVFLEQMSREVDDDVHVAMIWDQAGFHTSHQLKVPANITLLPLPPYSPELNPIENLWHYLRSHYWSNRAYDDYDALQQAACDAWHHVCLDPALIQTVCHAPYLHGETRNVQM